MATASAPLPDDVRALLMRARALAIKIKDTAPHAAVVNELEAMFRKKDKEKRAVVRKLVEEKNRADKQHAEEKSRAAKEKDEQVNLALKLAFSADVRITVAGHDESIPALGSVLTTAAPELAHQLSYVGQIVLTNTTVTAAKVFVRLIHMPVSLTEDASLPRMINTPLTADTLAVPADTLETTLFGALKLADTWLDLDSPVAVRLVSALRKLRADPASRLTSAPQWLGIITFAETAIANATPPQLTQEEEQELEKLPAAAREEKNRTRKLLLRRAALWKFLYEAGIQFFADSACLTDGIPNTVLRDLPIIKVIEKLCDRETKCRLACDFLRSIGMLGDDTGPCDALHALSTAREGAQLSLSVVDSLRNAITAFLAFDFDSLASSDDLVELDATTFLSLLMSEELKAESEDVVVDAFTSWSEANRDARLICEVAPAVRFPLAQKLHPLSARLKELMRAHPVVKELVDEATKQQLEKADALASASSPGAVPTTKRKLLHDDTPGGTVVPRAKARKLTPEAGVQPVTVEQLTQSQL